MQLYLSDRAPGPTSGTGKLLRNTPRHALESEREFKEKPNEKNPKKKEKMTKKKKEINQQNAFQHFYLFILFLGTIKYQTKWWTNDNTRFSFSWITILKKKKLSLDAYKFVRSSCLMHKCDVLFDPLQQSTVRRLSMYLYLPNHCDQIARLIPSLLLHIPFPPFHHPFHFTLLRYL